MGLAYVMVIMRRPAWLAGSLIGKEIREEDGADTARSFLWDTVRILGFTWNDMGSLWRILSR